VASKPRFANGPISDRTFVRELTKLTQGLRDEAGKALQVTAEQIHGALVFGTPVGGPPTSPDDPHPRLAKSNWIAILGASPDFSPRPPRSENETIDEASSTIRGAKADGQITIANGGDKVPYLGRLNNGSSFQAPAGFVEKAILAGIRALQGRTLLKG
jgi:hypothetical protein